MPKRLTKAEKAKIRRRKELSARKVRPLTHIDFWAISVQEAAAAMRRAGIADEIVSGWIYEQKPDWMPQLNPHPYFDDEEED